MIDFSMANTTKRRNIAGIPSIIPIVFPLITRKLNIDRRTREYVRAVFFSDLGVQANISKGNNFEIRSIYIYILIILSKTVVMLSKKGTSVIQSH